jgi:hypothetical protein
MRELIRHILKENRLQQELKQVIEDNGIFDAIDMVGGLKNFKKAFKNDPEFSKILDELTGVVDFSYYEKYLDKNPILFPFKYEIVGIKKNRWNTNSWPELNLIYDEDKLSPSDNETLKSIIAVIQNDNTTGKIKTKTLNFKDSNYFDITQINGKDVDLHEDEYSFSKEDVKRIYNKLYGESESLNESINKSDEKRNKVIEKIMDNIIFPEYNHIICGYYVKNDEVFNEPVVNVTFIGGYGTKLWPVTQGIQKMYRDILDEIWDTIYDYINIPVGVTMETMPKCDEQENIYLRESENKSEDKKLKLVKEMIYSLFDEVEFIEVDTNYEGKPLIKIYHDVDDTAANYDNWFSHRIQDEIKEMTGDGIILSPWWAAGWDWKYKNADFFIDVQKIEYDNEGNVINESDESKQERKFNKLVQKIEDYLNSNEYPSVKKFTVYYEDTHDDVIVNIFFNVQDSIKLGGGINSVIKRVGKQVMEDLEVFPMDFKYYIHFDRDINESSIKEKSLVKLIEKDGLYNFIEMSGLDFNQVRSLIKQIDNPKEILKQYIREFVLEYDSIPGENYGSLIGLKIPLSNTKLLNDIMVQDSDQIAVEIWGYEEDEYGDTEQTEQYLTTINDLTNEELLSILSWMMETIKFGYWD